MVDVHVIGKADNSCTYTLQVMKCAWTRYKTKIHVQYTRRRDRALCIKERAQEVDGVVVVTIDGESSIFDSDAMCRIAHSRVSTVTVLKSIHPLTRANCSTF